MHVRRLLSVAFTLSAIACSSPAASRRPTPSPSGDGAAPAGPTKRALIIGINRYRHAGANGVTNLAGCVNDAESMRALLVGKFEFPDDAEHIRVLKDEQATRAAIVGAVEQHLIAKASPGDVVVIFFAGHGSQMKDTSGTRVNGTDETIVPHDSRDPGGRVFDISGNEIGSLVERLNAKTDNVTVVFDSCNSGTLLQDATIRSRSIRTGYARVIPPDTREPPPPTAPPAAVATRGVGVRPSNAKWTFIAGARADELANEYDEGGRRHGAMTRTLVEALKAAPPGATYRDVMDVVSGRVTELFASQHPQLEVAGGDSVVFGDKASLAVPFVQAQPTPTGAKLDAGAVFGVIIDTIFEVYAAGEKTFAPGAGLAKVRVTAVNVDSSTAVRQSGGSIPANARAVERERKFVTPQVTVAVLDEAGSATLRAIRQNLARHQQIALATDRSRCDLTLSAAKGVVELRGLAASQPLFTVAEGPSATKPVVDTVLAWAQWFNLRALSNPASPLRVRLDVSVNGAPLAAPGRVTAGQSVVFTVTNNSFADLFIAIVDFSTDGSRTVLFPPRDSQPKLNAGNVFTLPPLPVSVPDGRTDVSDTIKLFATTSAVNFRTITSSAIPTATTTREVGSLADLFYAAAQGTTRNVGDSISLDTWTTAERMFSVVR